MKRFDSSSIGSTLLISLVAGLFVLGGCTADTLTGTTPPDAEEDMTVQQASHNQQASSDVDGGSNDDPDGDHNVDDTE